MVWTSYPINACAIISFQFKDEVEFMWRFARGYGDMYEMSTNTQEKKHYANIGKLCVIIYNQPIVGFNYN